MTGHSNQGRGNRNNNSQKGLTSIRKSIHCVPTPEGGSEPTEEDRIIISNFLETLAEIAMAVATRKLSAFNEKGEVID